MGDLSLPRFSWSSTCLYHGAVEADLVSLTKQMSITASNFGSSLDEFLSGASGSRSTWFFLLSSGSLAFYVLYRRRSLKKSHVRRSLEKYVSTESLPDQKVSWFKWLFLNDDSDILSSNPNQKAISGIFFGGPQDSLPPPPLSLNLDDFEFRRRKNLGSAVAPCPNCLKGTCRLRKHTHCYFSPFRRKTSAFSTSSPYSADDEFSDGEDSAKIKRSTYYFPDRSDGEGMSDSNEPTPLKLYDAKQRMPGDGRDRWSGSSQIPETSICGCCDCSSNVSPVFRGGREESLDSLSSATGSMLEFVKGAREIRRLVRETSFDSLASDISLAPRNDKSETVSLAPSICQSLNEEEVFTSKRLGSNAKFYTMTAALDLDLMSSGQTSLSSGPVSLEWDSHQNTEWTDFKDDRYKLALSGELDVQDEWEWDIESFGEVIIESEKRLPPSGRCSEERDPSQVETYKSGDHLSPLKEEILKIDSPARLPLIGSENFKQK